MNMLLYDFASFHQWCVFIILALGEETHTIMLANYDEDELKANMEEEQRHVEEVEKELHLAQLKAQEILYQFYIMCKLNNR